MQAQERKQTVIKCHTSKVACFAFGRAMACSGATCGSRALTRGVNHSADAGSAFDQQTTAAATAAAATGLRPTVAHVAAAHARVHNQQQEQRHILQQAAARATSWHAAPTAQAVPATCWGFLKTRTCSPVAGAWLSWRQHCCQDMTDVSPKKTGHCFTAVQQDRQSCAQCSPGRYHRSVCKPVPANEPCASWQSCAI